MAVLRAEALTRTYAGPGAPVSALRGVDLEIAPGAFLAVTGASGSGKSTLLNLLGGLDSPTSGRILVDGQDIAALGRDGLARYRRETVGMVFQSFNLIPSRTAAENVEVPLWFSRTPRRGRRARAAELLESVGLGPRALHKPSELSGGEQQRVAIARALANGPRILLADEPTGNLDSRTAREIVELIAGLNRDRGLTVVLVSHERELVREFAREWVELRDGEVVGRGVAPW